MAQSCLVLFVEKFQRYALVKMLGWVFETKLGSMFKLKIWRGTSLWLWKELEDDPVMDRSRAESWKVQ